jgi:hypothetical protein
VSLRGKTLSKPVASLQNPILMSHLRSICCVGIVLVAFFIVACNGSSYGILQPTPEDLCRCVPLEPDITDYRHVAKHVSISNISAQEIDVNTILKLDARPHKASGRAAGLAVKTRFFTWPRVSASSKRQRCRLRCHDGNLFNVR